MDAPVEVFVAYAHEDKALKDTILDRLKVLERERLIATWHDAEIPAGGVWDQEIKKYLEAAQIILLCISKYFLASEYIRKIEAPAALRRHESGKAIVIPIILDDCRWWDEPYGPAPEPSTRGLWGAFEQISSSWRKRTRFRDLQAVPRFGSPVRSSENQAALLEVVTGVTRNAIRFARRRRERRDLAPFKWLATIVGVLLIVTALYGHYAGFGLYEVGSIAVVLVGLTLVALAALGDRLAVGAKLFWLTSVIALLGGLLYYEAEKSRYVQGSVLFDRKLKNLSMIVDDPVRSRSMEIANEKKLEFVVFRDQILKSYKGATLVIPFSATEEDATFLIPTRCIDPGIGTNRPLKWYLKLADDGTPVAVQDEEDKDISRVDADRRDLEWKDHPCNEHPSMLTRWIDRAIDAASMLLGSDPAVARDARSATPPLPDEAIDAAIVEDLRSDDTPTRRSAREALSRVPARNVGKIIGLVRDAPDDYRVKLGVAVALTQMLRRDKSQREIIVPLLTDDDRGLLLDLVGHPDRTLRIYASEFLFDLGDPRIAELAIRRAAQAQDDNARYNFLFVAQDGWWRLSEESKGDLRPYLGQAKKQSGDPAGKLLQKMQ